MLRFKLFGLILVLVLIANYSCAEPIEEALDLQEAFVNVSKEVGPAVVSISVEHTERYQPFYQPFSQFEDEFFKEFFEDFFRAGPQREYTRIGLGSGVIIDKEGHILTNEHVVSGADKITVTFPDGREFKGELTGSDAYSDLAVLKIEPKGDMPFAKLGNSDNVKIGHWAIAIGNPFAFAVKNPEPTMTVGVISALNRSLPRTGKRVREYTDLIQTDAAINPGNSGGPLLNIYGEIIGINVAIFTMSGGSEGVGFAIPANAAKKIMKDLIEGREVLYGWLGVVIQDINSDLSGYFKLKEQQGALISQIIKDSPAEKARLKIGDVIVSADGERVKNTHDLIRRVLKKNVGDEMNLGVIRNSRSYSVNVKIGVRPEDESEEPKKEEKVSRKETEELKVWRGIEVSNITPEIVSRFNLSANKGVFVSSIKPLSPAAKAGMQAGDIIYEINRKSIKGLEDYYNVIKKASGDALLRTDRGYVVIKYES